MARTRSETRAVRAALVTAFFALALPTLPARAAAGWEFPAVAAYTAGAADNGMDLGADDAPGASITVTLPNPAAVGNGWEMGFGTGQGRGVIVDAPVGSYILAGQKTLTSLSLPSQTNYEFASLTSDGSNFRLVSATRQTALANGLEGAAGGSTWTYLFSSGYSATVADNGHTLYSGTAGGATTITLPSTSLIPTGWTIGVYQDGGSTVTLQTNGVSGGDVIALDGRSLTAYALPAIPRAYVSVSFDGANFRLLQEPGPILYNVLSYGAKCNGTTDDSAAFQAALNAANAAGGGKVYTPDGGNCAIAASLTLPSEVLLVDRGELTWTGAAAGPMFQTSASAATNRAGVIGEEGAAGKINPGNITGDIFAINGGWNGRLADLEIESGTATATGIDLNDTLAPLSGGLNNLAYWKFDNVTAVGQIGTLVRLAGNFNGSSPVPVTLNDFVNVSAVNAQQYCFNFAQWADTNDALNTYCQINGMSSSGIVFNSGAPTTNNGVYADSFVNLAVDTFGTGLNRAGIIFNNANQIFVEQFSQSPQAERGPWIWGGSGSWSICPYVNATGGAQSRCDSENMYQESSPILENGVTVDGLETGGTVDQLLGVNSSNQSFLGIPQTSGVLSVGVPARGAAFSFVAPAGGSSATDGITFQANAGAARSQIAATGSDPNIALELQPQGAGEIWLNGPIGVGTSNVGGVSCSGAPSASFASTNGIVTHC